MSILCIFFVINLIIMNNGIITRFIIVKILKKIRESTINIDKSFEVITEKYSISIKDKNYIYNVVITTIRNINTVEQIINKFNVKVNKKDISYYFIISAICQIFFLNQRDYAVTHSTCEALKKFNSKNKINFVNGLLRNLCRNKQSIKLSDLNISHHPRWFKKTVKDITSKKRKSIYNSEIKKPNIGIVFKNQKDINLIKAKEVMSENPLTINKNTLMLEAKKKMQEFKVQALVVLNSDNKVEGVIQIF